jgi:hypothetical protein
MSIQLPTQDAYQQIVHHCQSLFIQKAKDYGTAWRIMRLSSITDQIYIKAKRIRTLEQTGVSQVGEGVEDEYIGIINYCVIGMIQQSLPEDAPESLPIAQVMEAYQQAIEETKALMEAKNHDYGEAWRDMRVSSLTDLILMKIYRVKQIEDNQGKTLVSEGIKANYQDMMNYAIFALIRLGYLLTK